MIMRRDILAGIPLAVMASPMRFIKGICWASWRPGTPYATCLAEAARAGFRALEIRVEAKGELSLTSTADDAERVAKAARSYGLTIASLWALTPSSPSMVSPDPEVRKQALALARKAIELAPALECDSVLVATGVLGRGAQMEATHDEAWQRATAAYRELLPLAERAGITLTPENVWSKFLVSPRDMRDFVDQFQSPRVKVLFDTGNVMQYGFPEDWILTLGSRIHHLHFKDYKLASRAGQGQFTPLLEGDVQWQEVMKCLVKIGYRGYVTVEAGYSPIEGDPGYLSGLSRALDRIFSLI